ncbi:conserved hypothetical protein [Neospora caninum Liverpool]|uniref:Uncharacterized protein n=1 Tax=Neospora caninum (strain Liverpool) TaxID=572307 RepID=F0VQ35_NEOCL|nr:conserved hypothetical protein [Neospora caninum Liverpool]CBZ55832.1 conserved hypothetical protein [Neospora caninum Liverpool]|eukprot:XP_003885858.1 conserved hypothetical protein [Neospora caninum Liverpool]
MDAFDLLALLKRRQSHGLCPPELGVAPIQPQAARRVSPPSQNGGEEQKPLAGSSACKRVSSAADSFAPRAFVNSQVPLEQRVSSCPTAWPANGAAAATSATSATSVPDLPTLLASLNQLLRGPDEEKKANSLNVLSSLRLLQPEASPLQLPRAAAAGSAASGKSLPAVDPSASLASAPPRLHTHGSARDATASVVQNEKKSEPTWARATGQNTGSNQNPQANVNAQANLSALATAGRDPLQAHLLQQRQHLFQLVLQERLRQAGVSAASPPVSGPSQLLTQPGTGRTDPGTSLAAQTFPSAVPYAVPVSTPSPPGQFDGEGHGRLSAPGLAGREKEPATARKAVERSARQWQLSHLQHRLLLACQAQQKRDCTLAHAAHLAQLSPQKNGIPYSAATAATSSTLSPVSPLFSLPGTTDTRSSESPVVPPGQPQRAGGAETARGRSTGPAGARGLKAIPCRPVGTPVSGDLAPPHAVKAVRKKGFLVSVPKPKRQRQSLPGGAAAPALLPEKENAETAAATAAAVAAAVADAVVVSPTGEGAQEDFAGWVRRSMRPSRPTLRVRCPDCGGRASQCQCGGRAGSWGLIARKAQFRRLASSPETALEGRLKAEERPAEDGEGFPSVATQNKHKKRRTGGVIQPVAKATGKLPGVSRLEAGEATGAAKAEHEERFEPSPHRGGATPAAWSAVGLPSAAFAALAAAEKGSEAGEACVAGVSLGTGEHAAGAFEGKTSETRAAALEGSEKAPKKPDALGKKKAAAGTQPKLGSTNEALSKRNRATDRLPETDEKTCLTGRGLPENRGTHVGNVTMGPASRSLHDARHMGTKRLPTAQQTPRPVDAGAERCLRLVSPFFADLRGISGFRSLQVHVPRAESSGKQASRTERLLGQSCMPRAVAGRPDTAGVSALVWGPWKPRGVLEEAEKRDIHLNTLTEEYHKAVRLISQQGAYVLTAVGPPAVVAAAAVAHAVKATDDSEDESRVPKRRRLRTNTRFALHSRDFPVICMPTSAPCASCPSIDRKLEIAEEGEPTVKETKVKTEDGCEVTRKHAECRERAGGTGEPAETAGRLTGGGPLEAQPAVAEVHESISGKKKERDEESETGTEAIKANREGDLGPDSEDVLTAPSRESETEEESIRDTDAGVEEEGKADADPQPAALEHDRRRTIYPRMARDAFCFLAAERQTESAQDLLASPPEDEELEIPCGFAFCRLPTAAELDDFPEFSGAAPLSPPPFEGPATALLALSWCMQASGNRDMLKAVLVAAGCSLFACSSFSGFFFFRPSQPRPSVRRHARDPAMASLRAVPLSETAAGRDADACAEGRETAHDAVPFVETPLHACGMLWSLLKECGGVLSGDVVASLHADVLRHFSLLMDRVLAVHQHWPSVPPASSLFKYNGVACRNSPLRVDVNLSEAHWEWGDGELRRSHLRLQQRVLLLTRSAGAAIGRRFGSWRRPSSRTSCSSPCAASEGETDARDERASSHAENGRKERRDEGLAGGKQDRHRQDEERDSGREEAWRAITFGYIVSIGPHANDQKVHHDYHQEAFERNIVNAFFPLVDISTDNSATTFIISGKKIQSCAAAGDLILMDNTVRHYGSQHPAPTVRPLIYCSFADRRTTRTREAVGKKTHFYNWHQYPRLPGEAKMQESSLQRGAEAAEASDGTAAALERQETNDMEGDQKGTEDGDRRDGACEHEATNGEAERNIPEATEGDGASVAREEPQLTGEENDSSRRRDEQRETNAKAEAEEENGSGGEGVSASERTAETPEETPSTRDTLCQNEEKFDKEKRKKTLSDGTARREAKPFVSLDAPPSSHNDTDSLPLYLRRVLAYRQSLESSK